MFYIWTTPANLKIQLKPSMSEIRNYLVANPIQQRWFTTSLVAEVRKFYTKYDKSDVSISSTVERLIEKLAESGSVGDADRIGRPKRSRSNVDIEATRESIGEKAGTSIRRRGRESQISRSFLRRTLAKDPCLRACEIRLTRQPKPDDRERRTEFVQWIVNREKADAGFSSETIPSDEARFHLDGFVDRQNCRVRDSERPRVIGEKRTRPRRVVVWRGFWPGGVVGPCFLEDKAGRAATVDGARRRDAITRFSPPKLDDVDVANARFRRDGGTRRAADETIRLPRETFARSLVSAIRIGSCDLTRFLLTGLFEVKGPRRRSHKHTFITRGN